MWTQRFRIAAAPGAHHGVCCCCSLDEREGFVHDGDGRVEVEAVKNSRHTGSRALLLLPLLLLPLLPLLPLLLRRSGGLLPLRLVSGGGGKSAASPSNESGGGISSGGGAGKDDEDKDKDEEIGREARRFTNSFSSCLVRSSWVLNMSITIDAGGRPCTYILLLLLLLAAAAGRGATAWRR